jgi:hypothetical protein
MLMPVLMRVLVRGLFCLLLLLPVVLSPIAFSHSAPAVPLGNIAAPAKQFGLPFGGAPGVNSWLLGQLYGNTTGAYRRRNSDYRAGQGIHFGMDLSAACATPVLAIGDGVVSEVDGPHGSAPHNLVIEHAGNLASFYGHLLQRSSLRVGQRVKRGQQIGLSGDSQFTCISAPHLHLEIRDKSHQRFLNPVGFIAADWNSLTLVGGFGRGYQRDLAAPRRWQTLADQPAARRGGPLLNNYAQPFPVVANDQSLRYPARIVRLNATATPIAAATPATKSGVIRALTATGCCVAPFWSADSTRVLFIDRPNSAAAGLYSVDATVAAAKARQEFAAVVRLSPSERFAILSGPTTQLERLATGERVSIAASSLVFSPSEQRIAWVVSATAGRFDTIASTIYVADLLLTPKLRLGNTRVVARLYGGGLSGWINDNTLLVAGKRQASSRDRSLMALDLKTNGLKTLATALNLRGVSIAPTGRFVAYYIAFDNKSRNGMFVLDTSTGQSSRLPWFGSYRFRDSQRLLFIPINASSANHQLFEWNLTTGSQRLLLDLGSQVAGDDWQVSPDGERVVFVSANSISLKAVDLPQ